MGTTAMINLISVFFSSVLGFILYTSIISVLNPIIAIFLICTSLIHSLILKHISLYEHNNRKFWTPINKKNKYLADKMSNYEYGKDIRLYNLNEWLSGKFNKNANEQIKWEISKEKQRFLSVVSNVIIFMFREGIVYLYLFHAVMNGENFNK